VPQALIDRVRKLAARSGIEEADLFRLAIVAGLDRMETGEFNPFLHGKPKK
jgi:hypothetical protein